MITVDHNYYDLSLYSFARIPRQEVVQKREKRMSNI
jgi:hypothetical protein